MNNVGYKEYAASLGFVPPERPYVITDDMAQRYKKEFGLVDSHISFINELNSLFDLTGKTVLEIGGSNLPKELIIDKLKVKNWVSVDTPCRNVKERNRHYDEMKFFDIKNVELQKEMNRETYFICRGLTDDITGQFYGQFDIVVSVTCFEHIQYLSYALRTIYRCLKKNGILYARFAPIWSVTCRSHFWIPEIDLYLNKPSFISEYAHLLYTQREIYQILLKEYGPRQELERWSRQIKYGDRVNHYFFEDIEFFLKRSNFTESKAFFYSDIQTESALQDRLEKLHPGYKKFGNDVCRIVARKKVHMAEVVDEYLKNRGKEEQFPDMEHPLKCYLIATQPRSGSTLLSYLLWHTNLAGCPLEFLTNDRGHLMPLVIECDDFSINEYIKLLIKKTSTSNNVFGLKEFYPSYFVCGFPLSSYNPSFIHLIRKNKIRQGISHYKAKLDEVWSSFDKKKSELSREDYSFNRIFELIRLNTAEDLQWQRYFVENNISPVRVIYEDFVKDIPGTVSRVLKEALDIDLPPEQVPKPRLEKQSDILSDYYYYRFLSDLAAQGMTAEDFYASLGVDCYSE